MRHLLRAEWTKLWSVRRWVLGLLATVGLTLALSLLTAAGSGTDLNDHPEELGPVGPDGVRVMDERNFLHQPMTGDSSITARVVELTGHEGGFTHEWAKVGIMVRESAEPGSRYVAIMATPGHGVRLQANYDTDVAGSDGTAPRWLRLTRTGTTITGYESADGAAWSEVGTVELGDLPATVEVGMFATSPGRLEVESSVGGSSSGETPTSITGTFDNVAIAPPQAPADWREHDTSRGFVGGGDSTGAGGVFTVTGSGDVGPYQPDDDVTQLSLLGVNVGLIAVVAVGVLFITSEYRRGMIRTTFAVSPRRGRVLVAKAVVLGTATFVVGLAASLAAFFLTLPVLRSSGFSPPAYPTPSLADWPVQRAIVGAAVFLALVAVLSVGVGAIMRRSVGAITVLVVLFVASTVLIGGLPLSIARWVMRTTPAAGLSILQTVDTDHDATVEPWSMAPPFAGLGVLAAYAVAAIAVAVWLVRRRDA